MVKGGDFVLGIEACYILSRQQEMLPQEIVSNERAIFHLGSLLSRKQGECPGEPGSVFLQLQKGESTFFLLVDQVIDDIELPEQTTQLPPPSPALAEQLCPQVAVWMNLVVLLLDPAQVIPLAQQLGQGIGLFVPEHYVQSQQQEVLQQPVFVGDGDVVDQQLETEDGKKSGAASTNKQIKKNKKRPKSVDEETFKRVMAWTIAQFKQGKVGTEQLAVDQLPPGLVQQEGVSDTVLQYLIDQISLRCQESITPSRPGEYHGS